MAQIQSHPRNQAEAHLCHKPCLGVGEAKDNSKPLWVSPCLPEDANLGLSLGLYTKFTQGSLQPMDTGKDKVPTVFSRCPSGKPESRRPIPLWREGHVPAATHTAT